MMSPGDVAGFPSFTLIAPYRQVRDALAAAGQFWYNGGVICMCRAAAWPYWACGPDEISRVD